MFLNLMNTEEKENFLELIYKIATCDGEFAVEEEELVNNYKIELGIDTFTDTKSINELINYFSNKQLLLKKIVFFELYGMIVADGTIVDSEKSILVNLKDKFALGENANTQLINAVNELQKAYDTVYTSIWE